MNKIIDKVALIHIKNNCVLSTLSQSKNKLYFPGGKRENNESDIECLKREILEELNVHILENTVKFFGSFEAQADGHEPGVLVRMLCYFSDFSGTLKASNEVESFEWIKYEDRYRTSAVDILILEELKKQHLID
ncbi:NUDIX domain-containing protein [Sphingobacterium puteale]|uniref:NUDIX domain-containing protein n=1 Tax=Sphingobacterium puteale TaxID=2420510 RepID=A0A420VRC8_9SPHI|nr:NUDIX domain-containing protein [Sphingobacterium puteale]RKO68809.1 NUDIX domain-containing protein [Sphingobacterium puteale]